MDCFLTPQWLAGICVEKKIDLGNAILIGLGILGLISLRLAYRQFRMGQEAQLQQAIATRARFVLDLNQEFLNSDAERAFFYKLDYKDFFFDPDTFAQSGDERELDRLLYKLSYVGKLLSDGALRPTDVSNIRHIAARTLRNGHVLAYLKFLQEEQLPDHGSFADAICLFEQMFGKDDPAYAHLKSVLMPPIGDRGA